LIRFALLLVCLGDLGSLSSEDSEGLDADDVILDRKLSEPTNNIGDLLGADCELEAESDGRLWKFGLIGSVGSVFVAEFVDFLKIIVVGVAP
jgi:hypothetical protein